MSTEVKQLEPVEQTNSESVTDAQHDPAPVCSLQQGDTAEAIATAQNEPQAAQVDEAPDANVAPEAANKDSKTVTEVSAKASPKKRKGNKKVKAPKKDSNTATKASDKASPTKRCSTGQIANCIQRYGLLCFAFA